MTLLWLLRFLLWVISRPARYLTAGESTIDGRCEPFARTFCFTSARPRVSTRRGDWLLMRDAACSARTFDATALRIGVLVTGVAGVCGAAEPGCWNHAGASSPSSRTVGSPWLERELLRSATASDIFLSSCCLPYLRQRRGGTKGRKAGGGHAAT